MGQYDKRLQDIKDYFVSKGSRSYTNILAVFDPQFGVHRTAVRVVACINGSRTANQSDERWISAAERIIKHINKFKPTNGTGK